MSVDAQNLNPSQASGRPVALVTGGSRGIGAATCAALARSGHDVAFCYRAQAAEASTVEEQVKQAGGRAKSQAVDVTDPAAVSAFVSDVEEALGPIDVLVANAGITRDGALVLMSDENWHDVIDTNLTGTFLFCREVAMRMGRRGRGSVITMTSISGIHGNRGQSNYAASKAGIIGLTRSLAKEMGRMGVRVNAVAPGFIETDMTEAVLAERGREMKRLVPLRRMGRAEEVAELVSFLASAKASYITGQVIGIDGGMVV